MKYSCWCGLSCSSWIFGLSVNIWSMRWGFPIFPLRLILNVLLMISSSCASLWVMTSCRTCPRLRFVRYYDLFLLTYLVLLFYYYHFWEIKKPCSALLGLFSWFVCFNELWLPAWVELCIHSYLNCFDKLWLPALVAFGLSHTLLLDYTMSWLGAVGEK